MTEVICPSCKKPISQHFIVTVGTTSVPVCRIEFERDGFFYGFKPVLPEPSRIVDADEQPAKPDTTA